MAPQFNGIQNAELLGMWQLLGPGETDQVHCPDIGDAAGRI